MKRTYIPEHAAVKEDLKAKRRRTRTISQPRHGIFSCRLTVVRRKTSLQTYSLKIPQEKYRSVSVRREFQKEELY